MNAAVLHALGKPPRFEQFAEPVAGEDEVIVNVRAAALKPVDKQMASRLAIMRVRASCPLCADWMELALLTTEPACTSLDRGGRTARDGAPHCGAPVTVLPCARGFGGRDRCGDAEPRYVRLAPRCSGAPKKTTPGETVFDSWRDRSRR